MKKRNPSASDNMEHPIAEEAKALSKPTVAPKRAGKKAPATTTTLPKSAATSKVAKASSPAKIQEQPAEIRQESAPKVPPQVKANAKTPPAKAVAKKPLNKEKKGSSKVQHTEAIISAPLTKGAPPLAIESTLRATSSSIAPLTKGVSPLAIESTPRATSSSIAPLIKGEPSPAGDLLPTAPTKAVSSGKTKKPSKKGVKAAPAPVQMDPPQTVAAPQAEVAPPPRKVILPPPGFGDTPKVEPKAEAKSEVKAELPQAPQPQPASVAVVTSVKADKKKPTKKGGKKANTAAKQEGEPLLPKDATTVAGDIVSSPQAAISAPPLIKGKPSSAGDLKATETSAPIRPPKPSKKGVKAAPAPVQMEPPQTVVAPQAEVAPPPRKVILPPPGFGDTPKVEPKAEAKSEVQAELPQAPQPQPASVAVVTSVKADKKKPTKKGGKKANTAAKQEGEPLPPKDATTVAGDIVSSSQAATSAAPLIKVEPSSAEDLKAAETSAPIRPPKPSKKGVKAASVSIQVEPPQIVAAPQAEVAPPPRKVILPPPGFGDTPKIEPKAELPSTPESQPEPVAVVAPTKANKKKVVKKGKKDADAPEDLKIIAATLSEGTLSSDGGVLSALSGGMPSAISAEHSLEKVEKSAAAVIQTEQTPVIVEQSQVNALPQPEIPPPPRKVILPPPGFEDAPKVAPKLEVKIELEPQPEPPPIVEVTAPETEAKKSTKKGKKGKSKAQVAATIQVETIPSDALAKGATSSAIDDSTIQDVNSPLIEGEPSSAGDLLTTTTTEAVVSGKTKKSSKKGAKAAPVSVPPEPPQEIAVPQPEILPLPRKVILPPPGFEEKIEPKVEVVSESKPESLPPAVAESTTEKGGQKKGKSNKAGNVPIVAVENTPRSTETTVMSAIGVTPAKSEERYVEPTPDELYALLNELEIRRLVTQSDQSASAQVVEQTTEQTVPKSDATTAVERRESRSARRRRKWLERRQLLREQQSTSSTESATEQQDIAESELSTVVITDTEAQNTDVQGALASTLETAKSDSTKGKQSEAQQQPAGDKSGKNRRNKKKKQATAASEAATTSDKSPETPAAPPQKRIIEVPQFAKPYAELIAPVPIEKPTEKDGRKFGSKKAKAAVGEKPPQGADKTEQVEMPVRREDKRDNRQRAEAQKVEMPAPPPRRRKKQSKVYSVHKNRNLPPLPDELAPLVESVDRFIQNNLFIPDEASIVIGVSGGVDSVAMLDIIATLSLKRGYQITVAHCNHGLRGNESDTDEKLVRSIAGSYRAQYRNTKVNVPEYARKNHTSVENAARILRYQFFEKTARSIGARFVLTAHNADDAAETLLLNLLRGSGLTGLAGMPPRRDLAKKIHLVRPLLQLPKERLRNYAMIRQLEWREDSSNASRLFMRNKIRHDLLPKLRDEYTPAIADILVRTTRILQGAEAVVSERVEQISATMVRQTGNEIRLNTAFFDTVNDFLKGEIVQSIIRKLGAQPVSMNTVDRVIALADSEIHAECRITGAITAIRDRSDIVFTTEVSAEVYKTANVGETTDAGNYVLRLSECGKKDVQLGDNPSVEFFDAALLPKQLTLRTWRDGDTFRPLGLGGSMKISDFLTNIKISATERKKVLVLCAGNEIIWVCGKRISDSFKITTATRHAIRAEMILPQQLGDESGASASG